MLATLLIYAASSLGQVETLPLATPTTINAKAPSAVPQPAAKPDTEPGRARLGDIVPATEPAAQEKAAPTNAASVTAPTCATCAPEHRGFLRKLLGAYVDEFHPKENGDEEPAPRRALPAPFSSPPFPGAEWQGYPLVGVPPDTTKYPLMKALDGSPVGDFMDKYRLRAYGWLNGSYNWSSSHNSNTPDSYWIYARQAELDQAVFRVERQVDSVQTDHIDVGFRSSVLFGIDYRYMTAGGWWPADTQNLKHNFLYGVDFTEQYVDVYVPNIAKGLIVRVGRWIACPDIETQFAPDNYMGSHSILFTFDTYTQTGIWLTLMLNDQWTIQGGVNAGNDMAPWYRGATPCGTIGIRWVSKDNMDSVYAVLNQINTAQFRRFDLDGQPAGHDNFNYPVVTWQHKFNDKLLTKQEAYFMWQNNTVLGGTVSIGNTKRYGGGGGIGADIPATTAMTYGTVNYTVLQTSKKGFITFRNEWWRDEDGMRSGFPGTYTSHAFGITHNFTQSLQVRPEIGYYRNWTQPAFDLGTRQGMFMAGLDVTLRF